MVDLHLYGLTDLACTILVAWGLSHASNNNGSSADHRWGTLGWTIFLVALSIPVHLLAKQRTHLTGGMFGDSPTYN